MRRALFACCFPLAVGCVGTTGADIVDFDAAAAGPRDARAGEPLSFTNDRGFAVELGRATLHVGALYLDQTFPVSGAQSATCILPGTYVAEATLGRDVDLLDPSPQTFPGGGHGTTLEARAGQVWLTHDDVNAVVDPSGAHPTQWYAGPDATAPEQSGATAVAVGSAAVTGLDVKLAEDPLTCVARGTAIYLENIEEWKATLENDMSS